MYKFAIAAACVASTQALTMQEAAEIQEYEQLKEGILCGGLCMAAAGAAATGAASGFASGAGKDAWNKFKSWF